MANLSQSQPVLLMLGAIVVVLGLRSLLHKAFGDVGSSSVVDTVMEPLAGIYGLLLAFLVGSVADRTLELRGALQDEANAFFRVDQIAQRLSAPMAVQLRQSLQLYARAEAAVRAGRLPADQSAALLNNIWLSVATYEPTRERDDVLQSEALGELRILREQREIAGRANQHAYGFLIWLVLIVGSVCVIGVCLLAGLADPRGALYLAALTAMIAITLYVFYALSRPLNSVQFRTLSDVALAR